MKIESKDKFRDSLGDLLNDLPDEVPGLEDSPQLPRIKTENTQLVLSEKAKTKAKRVMKSLLSFYLSEDIIDEHEYIKAKSELDEYALSMLIRQMQNSESAISTLMDTIINEGDTSPRMFEVLSDLQRTLLDIIKSQTMYMVAIEENAKKISRDIDVYHGSENTSNKKSATSSGLKTRGTKDLMRALQDSINEEDIQDIDGDQDEE